MGIIAIEELPARLVGGRTLAGLDLGDKTIGVAVSDRGLSFAHPRPVIMRKKFSLDAALLLAQLQKDNVGAIALGLPVNMDGSEGPRAQKSRAFVRNMAALSELPFVLWDERLSTVAAERTLVEMDFSRKKRAGKIDSAAAAFILQGVLDRLQSLGPSAQAEPDSSSGS
ncbi:Holliday junction resolvase [Mesorhizobium amorphae CCBAU 01583]|nr:Holliday junction resolvase [Mesorhizobium amorphae CCBAU 01583]